MVSRVSPRTLKLMATASPQKSLPIAAGHATSNQTNSIYVQGVCQHEFPLEGSRKLGLRPVKGERGGVGSLPFAAWPAMAKAYCLPRLHELTWDMASCFTDHPSSVMQLQLKDANARLRSRLVWNLLSLASVSHILCPLARDLCHVLSRKARLAKRPTRPHARRGDMSHTTACAFSLHQV